MCDTTLNSQNVPHLAFMGEFWCHDDTWKHFLHYWPFVRGIHCWLIDFTHKGSVMWKFDVYDLNLDVWYYFELTKCTSPCVHGWVLVSWWHMETLPALLALCEENPLLTDWFHPQRVSNVEIWCLWSRSVCDTQQSSQWSIVLMFIRTNCWTNSWVASDWRCDAYLMPL